jgi:hypothetical protein
MAAQPGNCRCPPKKSLGERYSQALLEHPIKTKTITSFILSGISGLISKYYSNGGVINADMLVTALQMAALSCPPYSHFWYPILEMISSNPLVKTIVDQLFWRPLLIAYSFVLMNVLKGKSWAQIREIFKASYAGTVKNAWRIWPAAQLLNQSVVPLQFRTVSMDLVSFFWDMYLTLAITSDAGTAPPKNAPPNDAPPAGAPLDEPIKNSGAADAGADAEGEEVKESGPAE